MSASTKSRPKVATDSDKALPDAPIMLTPLRKHAPSPFFPGRQLAFTTQPPAPPTHGRLRWVLLLPALLVGLLVFVLATILLLYFFVLRRVPGAAVAPVILVAEPTHGLLGLTISTLATHTASIGAPVLVSVAGYCVAGTWLKEQAFPRQTRVALPTPLQYAHMVQVLVTARPISVYRASLYLRSRRTRVPRAFRVALALTGLVLGLSYTLILADVWLHAASSVVDGRGRYPLAPALAYLALLYAYALTAGGIYLWAARLRAPLVRGRSAAQLAHRRLADPLALIGALYPAAHPDDAEDPSEENENTARLELGTDDADAFGVYQRPAPWIMAE
ncbi:hypothetical protein B0H17DRAFT_1205604 [Mycena rosella]|uniref:Uncharacterized protein n=1 Tax=Mycena rosella TaxID=1033263 RepID=A0AAD7D6T6_MYCRO|nr:hypothetical protein B0H17DRAFT_1205604 [Mycena rosella]